MNDHQTRRLGVTPDHRPACLDRPFTEPAVSARLWIGRGILIVCFLPFVLMAIAGGLLAGPVLAVAWLLDLVKREYHAR